MMPTDRLHVVTGGPGSGKSTLIGALAAAGVATSPEVGRRIIREQLASGGDGLPWGNERAFADLMIVGEVAAHAAALARGEPVVLDRGVPDVIGYLRLCGLPVPDHVLKAVGTFRYAPRVFVAPPWREIFAADAERRQDYAEAEATHAAMIETYTGLGYELVPLPLSPVAERVRFVRGNIGMKEDG